jgi:hypothetical protein
MQRFWVKNKIKVRGKVLVASSRRRVKPAFDYRFLGFQRENTFLVA